MVHVVKVPASEPRGMRTQAFRAPPLPSGRGGNGVWSTKSKEGAWEQKYTQKKESTVSRRGVAARRRGGGGVVEKSKKEKVGSI